MKFFIIIIIQKAQTSFQNCSLKILTTKENLSVLTCLSQSKGHTFKRSHWFSSLFSQQVLVYIQWLALPNPFLVPLTPLSISIPKCSDISLNYLHSKSKQKLQFFLYSACLYGKDLHSIILEANFQESMVNIPFIALASFPTSIYLVHSICFYLAYYTEMAPILLLVWPSSLDHKLLCPRSRSSHSLILVLSKADVSHVFNAY